MRTVDLFAGIGGLRRGFERVGFETVFANDFEPSCKVTYDLNYPDTPLTLGDIRDIDVNTIPDYDFLLVRDEESANQVIRYGFSYTLK
ncbi:MAG TPA: DNA cytosine methyltransferase, partial [Aggregatilineales bacterium]|nr:DNA cytosine methyltransferase [Aggregatilineales bacterium]